MMIISQLLLAIFLGYWLFSQFADNKKLLSEELERGLRQSENQAIDSLLVTNLINPFLNDTGNFFVIMGDPSKIDSNSFPYKYKFEDDSTSRMLMHLSGNGEEILKFPNYPNRKEKIAISVTDNITGSDSTCITVHAMQDTSNQLLFQSVRLFISSVGVFTDSDDSMSSFLYSNIDTILLKKLFKGFMEEKHWGFSVEWMSANNSIAVNKSPSGIFLDSHLVKNSYGADINRYQFYLIESIAPQIVFAILLLLITTIAFRMAYVNLKNQRKLIIIKNDFISNISHELKTPVSTVKVALEALLDFDMNKNPKLTKEYLEMAHGEMNRLDLLINQVLNNSALEDGNNFIFPEQIDLTILINEVLQSMQPRFDQLDAEINFQTGKDSIIVQADKLHIHGVLINLIDNSLKYTLIKPKISINLTQNEKETKLTISDNGVGIPVEYLDKIFDKFFRVPTGDKHNIKGYGLGLNYAALVMQHHKGTVSVKNIDEGGCEFTLSFPNII